MAFINRLSTFAPIVLALMLVLLQTASAQQTAEGNTLPKSILASVPIIPVDVSNASTVVQLKNDSLVVARPDIASLPASNITSLPRASVIQDKLLPEILNTNYFAI